MWTGDQGRGGNTGSKCQQMEPEVVVRHNIARGVKIKEGLCPEQRGAFYPNPSFFFVKNGTFQIIERYKQMLPANFTQRKIVLIVKAFEPSFYLRLHSSLNKLHCIYA